MSSADRRLIAELIVGLIALFLGMLLQIFY